MLSLNPTCSQFNMNIPHDFVPEHIRKKYNKKIAKYNNQIIKDIGGLIHESIVEVTLLGLNSHIMEQPQVVYDPAPHDNISMNGYNRNYISASNLLNGVVQLQFSVQFRIGSGFLNYFAMLEILMYYHSLYQSQEFMAYPVIPIKIYDQYRQEIGTIKLYDVIPDSMETLTFTRSKDPGTERFSVNFVANNVDIDLADPVIDEPMDPKILTGEA